MPNKLAGFLLLTVFAVSPALSQAKPDALVQRLDAIAASHTEGNKFMGTVMVVDGDKVLLDKGYGFADVDKKILNTPEIQFRLGSLTKQFTATLILLMQEEGKLHVTDLVGKYLPDAPKTWEKITIANLLGHTSGIHNFTDKPEFHAWGMKPRTSEEELAFFRDDALDFEPGTKFAYSNSNFEVLGMILEKVSGQTYGDLLKTRLFVPLGMKSTGLDVDGLVLPHRAQGYQLRKEGLKAAESESMSVPWAAGSIYSTTGDLLIWEHALFGGKVLHEDSLKAMTTPGKGDYGYGLFIARHDGVTEIQHGGGIEGFNTMLSYVPERKLVVVVLANVNGMAPQEIATQLTDTVLGKTVTLPSERKALPMAVTDLPKYVGVYDLVPGFSVTVAVDGDHLTAEGTGQPALKMAYQGAKDGHATFFIAGPNVDVEFVPDVSGTITSLILHQNGDHIARKRSGAANGAPGAPKSAPLAATELPKYVGVYDILPQFSLTVAVDGDHLMVQGTGQPALKMVYQGLKDGHATFSIEGVEAHMEFVPGAGGQITSLILHQNGDHPAKKR